MPQQHVLLDVQSKQDSRTLKQLVSLQRAVAVKKQIKDPWMCNWCRDEEDAWARGVEDHANLPHSHHLSLCSVLRRVLPPREKKHTVTVLWGPFQPDSTSEHVDACVCVVWYSKYKSDQPNHASSRQTWLFFSRSQLPEVAEGECLRSLLATVW